MAALHPNSASLPSETRTPRLWLRPLRAVDVELDYDAVMESPAALRSWSQSTWPADDFPLAENLYDLVRHQREHESGEAYTFTVLDPGGTRCLGCVYLVPPRAEERTLVGDAQHPVRVTFWVRASEVGKDLDRHLLTTLREWLDQEWRFDAVLFTIAAGDARQAALLGDAGLTPRLDVTLPDGRRCRVFA
jgi:hypothetical protein